MRQTGFLFVLIICFCSSCAQDKKAKIDEVLNAYAAQNKFNGTALVAQNGKIILEKGYGVKNVDTRTPDDNQTIYQIGSVTKTFTSTAVMLLQEQGKLNVKDKLAKYFPDYAYGDKVTLENLLNHTSGIPDYTQDREFITQGLYKHNTRADLLATFKDKPLQFEPGTQHVYCNAGYALLGFIIEDITKMSYYEAIRHMIFDPLKMTHSGFNFAGLVSNDKPTGYLNIDDDYGMPAPMVDSSASFSATGIYSTAEDMNKYATALMEHQLLKESSFKTATTPYLNNYGYGWMETDTMGMKMIGHTGGIRGFVSIFFMIPEDKTVIILLNNVMASDMKQTRNDIAAILHNKPYTVPAVRTVMKMSDDDLEQYAGSYSLAPGVTMKIFAEDGKLKAQIGTEHAFRIYPETKDHFFFKIIEAGVEFTRNDKNEVEQLVFHQGGNDIPGKKM